MAVRLAIHNKCGGRLIISESGSGGKAAHTAEIYRGLMGGGVLTHPNWRWGWAGLHLGQRSVNMVFLRRT